VANLTRRDGEEFLSLAAAIPVLAQCTVVSLDEAGEGLAGFSRRMLRRIESTLVTQTCTTVEYGADGRTRTRDRLSQRLRVGRRTECDAQPRVRRLPVISAIDIRTQCCEACLAHDFKGPRRSRSTSSGSVTSRAVP